MFYESKNGLSKVLHEAGSISLYDDFIKIIALTFLICTTLNDKKVMGKRWYCKCKHLLSIKKYK